MTCSLRSCDRCLFLFADVYRCKTMYPNHPSPPQTLLKQKLSCLKRVIFKRNWNSRIKLCKSSVKSSALDKLFRFRLTRTIRIKSLAPSPTAFNYWLILCGNVIRNTKLVFLFPAWLYLVKWIWNEFKYKEKIKLVNRWKLI